MQTILVVTFCFTSCINDKKETWEGANLQPGDLLPEFSITLQDGSSLNTESLDGKVSLILLFTVTCPHCQEQIPIVERLYQEYKENVQVIFAGISREEGEAQVGKYWKEQNYTLPYSAQETRYIYSLFAQSTVPRIYISNGKRIIQAVFAGDPVVGYDRLKETIKSVLQELPPE